jgi:hypothetical protein
LYIVITIQRANRSRVLAFKSRITYLRYYWETLKVDMSKILISETKNVDAAKQVSFHVFGMKGDLREKFILTYCEYCRLVFILKFIFWRMQRLRFKKQEIRFDWESEVP